MRSFISKLNDRNLQRKRESGITTYALYSVLLFCAYKLFKNLELFLNDFDFKKNILNIIELFIFFSNCYIAIYFILLSFEKNNKIFSTFKLLKYEQKNFDFYKFLLRSVFFLLPFIILIYSASYYVNDFTIDSIYLHFSVIKKIDNNKDIYFVLMVILNLIPFIVVTSLIPSFKNEKKLKIDYYDDKNSIDFFIFLISIIVICFSTYLSFKSNFQNKLIFFKIITLYYFILFIIEKIIIVNNSDSNTISLENLEYEIYLKDLQDDEIRKTLQENYIGYFIEDWITYNKTFILDLEKEILDKCNQIDQYENDEISDETRNKINLEVKNIITPYEEQINKKLIEINNILEQNKAYKKLSENENNDLIQLNEEFKTCKNNLEKYYK